MVLRMSFVRITDSVNAALLLSQCRYWQKINAGKPFYHTQAQWKHEIGLGRYELEAARKKLKDLGILKEWTYGTPPKLYYCINDSRVEELFDVLVKELSDDHPTVEDHTMVRDVRVKACAGVVGGVTQSTQGITEEDIEALNAEWSLYRQQLAGNQQSGVLETSTQGRWKPAD